MPSPVQSPARRAVAASRAREFEECIKTGNGASRGDWWGVSYSAQSRSEARAANWVTSNGFVGGTPTRQTKPVSRPGRQPETPRPRGIHAKQATRAGQAPARRMKLARKTAAVFPLPKVRG